MLYTPFEVDVRLVRVVILCNRVSEARNEPIGTAMVHVGAIIAKDLAMETRRGVRGIRIHVLNTENTGKLHRLEATYSQKWKP